MFGNPHISLLGHSWIISNPSAFSMLVPTSVNALCVFRYFLPVFLSSMIYKSLPHFLCQSVTF